MGAIRKYSDEIAEEVISQLERGRTLRDICGDEGMPSAPTVIRWTHESDEFAERYARAREIGYQVMADAILEIADDGANDWMERRRRDGSKEVVLDREHVERSKLRLDTRKWLLAKALPKIYGDKTAINVAGTVTLEQLVSAAYEPPRIEGPVIEGKVSDEGDE